MIKRSTSKWHIIAISALILVGCEGSRGPDGVDMDDVDHIPPEIRLTAPPTDRYILQDIVTIEAFAEDPDGEIAYVSFFLNGSNLTGEDEDSMTVFSPPYRYNCDLTLAGVPYGILTVSAVAMDTSGNIAATPTNIYQRLEFSALDTLSYFMPDDEPDAVLLPDATVELDSLGYTDTLYYFNYMAVRFTAPFECELLSVEFFFMDPASFPDNPIEHPSGFWTLISYPETDGSPGSIEDGLRTGSHQVVYDDWTYVDLRALSIGAEAYSFEAGDDFFLGMQSTEPWSENLNRGLYLAIHQDTIDPDPGTDRSWEYEGGIEGRRWGTLRQHSDDQTEKYDWVVRAVVVDYEDGSLMMLSPNKSVRYAEIELPVKSGEME